MINPVNTWKFSLQLKMLDIFLVTMHLLNKYINAIFILVFHENKITHIFDNQFFKTSSHLRLLQGVYIFSFLLTLL